MSSIRKTQRNQESPRPAAGKPLTPEKLFAKHYTLADAKAVASAWSRNVAYTKAMLGAKLQGYGKRYVDQIVRDAKAPLSPDAASMRRFLQTYTLADAKAVAQSWGIKVADAKVSLGQKLKAYDKPYVDGIILDAKRPLAPEQKAMRKFLQTYSLADAQAVAGAWGLKVAAAKVMLGSKLRSHGKKYVDGIVSEAKKPLGEEAAALRKFLQTYGFDDAAAVATSWGIKVESAKVMLGGKLMSHGKKYVDAIVAEAALPVPDDAAALRRFLQTYSLDDAKAVAQAWGLPVANVKVMLGTKILEFGRDFADTIVRNARAKRGA